MDRDAVWAAIDAERMSLADLLHGLAPEQWSTPSLCTGWTVKDVAAHITLSHVSPGRAVAELVRHRGSFNRMVRETARHRAASTSTEALVDQIRGMAGSRRHPIGTHYLDPLADSLVHGQDIAIPLGIDRPMPVDAAVAGADRVWTMGFPFSARRRLRGIELIATDADWTRGTGTPVHGPIAVLLLVLTGRRVRLDELVGPGVTQVLSEPRG